MGLFSKLFKKKNSIVNATQSNTFDNPECQKFWSLKTYIDDLLLESRYIAKSEYRPRLLEEKKTIEYFAVLDNSGMPRSMRSQTR